MRIKSKTVMDQMNAEKPDDVLADLEAKHGCAAPSGSAAGEPIWCDRCRGRGRTFVMWNWSNGYEEEITERCEVCFGRGHFDDGDDEE